MPESHKRMMAFEIGEPRCVLILGGEAGALRVRWSQYRDAWCGGTKQMIKARRKGLLRTVHSVQFDPIERRWRVERDEIGRDVLIIGPRIALLHSVRDESDRFMDDQMADLFGNRGWIAREAADAAARLAERMGCELERVAL
ncbi:hypothetical protein K7H13_06375 [Qipengyuania citrea]|uniref:hypothetical protein n=1 Tax=Qipengyuania citrea TaxID=225971 RepID=UPI001E5777DA|nr:hypothetical protein [Qipengyuania citrea]MCD1590383.1 hypothetical protein [Qipengyuania citrea]